MNPSHEPDLLEFLDDNTLQQMFSDADGRMDPEFRELLAAEIECRAMERLGPLLNDASNQKKPLSL